MAAPTAVTAPTTSPVGFRAASAALDAARTHTAEAERDVAQSLHARVAFLAKASRCLADSLDYGDALATVAGMALPHLGAWCVVAGAARRTAGASPDAGQSPS